MTDFFLPLLWGFLDILKWSLFYIFVSLFVIFVIQTIPIFFNFNFRHSAKWNMKHFFYRMRKKLYFGPVEFIKWVIIDIIRGKDRRKIFGLTCYTGYYGQGKTLGAVTMAKELKKIYGDEYHVFTNFWCSFADGRITCWQDLLSLPKKTIVIFDEIQSTFASQSYADFPVELLWKLTQCRKSKLAIYASSPVYSRMSIQLRESTEFVVECKNILNLDRLFTYTYYHAAEYEKAISSERKPRCVMFRIRVASDSDYKLYNTSEIVERFDISPEKRKEADFENRLLKKLRNW